MHFCDMWLQFKKMESYLSDIITSASLPVEIFETYFFDVSNEPRLPFFFSILLISFILSQVSCYWKKCE